MSPGGSLPLPLPRPVADAAPLARTRGSLRAWARSLATVALWTGIGLVAGLAVVLTVAPALGRPSFAVLSGSMEPAIHTGDLVVDRRISPLDIRIGDVVTFPDPTRGGVLVTHRVRSLRVEGGLVRVVTRGDANTSVERWAAPVDGSVGRVEYRIPRLGYVTNRIGSRLGRLLLIVVPALLLGLLELRRIWRPGGDA